MARQPKSRQPKAKFTPRCMTCKAPYHRFVNSNGKLINEPTCKCK